MSNKKDWRAELDQAAEHLRDPLRMRIAVAGVALVVMFFAVSEPLHGRIKDRKRDLNDLENTTKVAEEVLLLRAHMDKVEPGILRGGNNDAIRSHLINLVRAEDTDLIRIDASAPERLGPIESIHVKMAVSGSFSALSRLLQNIESSPLLTRIESIDISPAEKDKKSTSMNLSLRMLKDKS
ncbi:MAG: hypothetical protein WBD20_07330 [Pirellulaceae bacterium]